MMNVELFLEGQTKWGRTANTGWSCFMRCLSMLAMKGRRRQIEWSAMATGRAYLNWIQRQTYLLFSLSAQNTKEEILSLYLEVYKQHRLPGSPPRKLELTDNVVSSFKGHQRKKEERTPGVTMRPWSIDAQPSNSRVPGKRETSIEKSLAPIREAHQKVLASPAALKGEIERLSCPLPQSHLEIRVRSKSRDCWIHGATESKRRHFQVHFTDSPTPYHLPRDSQESGKGKLTLEDSDLGEPLELGQGLPLSLEDQSRVWRKRDPLLNHHWGVPWMGNMKGWDDQDPWLVEGFISSARSAQLQKIGMEGAGLV